VRSEGEIPPELAAAVDAIALPGTDMAPPGDVPAYASGAPGYSHYVFRNIDGEVIPTLVEGGREEQTRCQDEALPCSYQELAALYDSDDDIPEELGMTRTEIGVLLDELGQTEAALGRLSDPSAACAEGYRPQPLQVPNMGSHFTNIEYVLDGVFDPSRPEIILYGVADNENPRQAFSATCSDGEWTGDIELTVVGASFILPPSEFGADHPDAFSGPLDQWHIHYSLCNGTFPTTREKCEDAGGSFNETVGWMIHVWAIPEFDNQFGVFSMWNASLWPAIDPDELRETRDVAEDDNVTTIENFDFGAPVVVTEGDEVIWSNTDAVPHTVTGGVSGDVSGEFDSGAMGPGQTFVTEFDETGEFTFFCSLHPDMEGTVIVE
jgi:plastocyanin